MLEAFSLYLSPFALGLPNMYVCMIPQDTSVEEKKNNNKK